MREKKEIEIQEENFMKKVIDTFGSKVITTSLK